jgi:hypothetical protein
MSQAMITPAPYVYYSVGTSTLIERASDPVELRLSYTRKVFRAPDRNFARAPND